MGQEDWRYRENEAGGRGGGPAVPPNWEQERADPYRQPRYQPPPRFIPQGPPPQAPAPQEQYGPGPGMRHWPQQDQFSPPPPAPPVPPAKARPAARAKAGKPQQGKKGNPLVGFGIIFGVIGLAAWGLVAVFGGGSSSGSAPPAAAPAATVPASHAASAKPGFPPATPAGFQAFAATGDASQVHEVASAGEGLPSCPQPARYVTVSPAVTGRALEADLSAYFVQNGLLGNQCGAVVFAYHGMSDYRANKGNGFTDGRVILTNNGGSAPQRNLEVDTGSATSTQAEFDFNF